MELRDDPTRQGLFAGLLGSLVYLPVMILLQPTVFALFVFGVFPGVNQTAGEVLGWLIHVAILAGMAAILAKLLRDVRESRILMTAGVGWSFLTGFFVIFAAASAGLSLSLFGWILESVANTVNGLVVGYTIAYLRQ
jgi:hypothetical protein